MRAWGLAAMLVAVMASAGCSGSISVGGNPELSADELAKTISTQYAERVGKGIALTEIDCKDVEAKEGAIIECRGRNNRDVELEIGGEVTAVDTGDDRASYDWRVERAFAPGVLYERGVRRVLTEQENLTVTDVRCPTRIEIVVGAEVDCSVTVTGRGSVPSILTLTDTDGGFRVRAAG